MATQPDAVVSVLDHTLAETRTGWIRILADFDVVAHDLSGGTIGEPPRQAFEERRIRWDANGDGQMDFVTLVCAEGRFDFLGIWDGVTWTELVPLPHTRLLSGDYLTATTAILVEPVNGRSWSSGGVTLERTPSLGDPDPSHHLSRSEGYLGLRLDIASGVHLAWFRPSDESFAFEPRPGRTLPAGSVPESLWAVLNDGEVIVCWNWSLTNHVLESATMVAGSAWQMVTPSAPGRAVLPVVEAAAFHRLRKRP